MLSKPPLDYVDETDQFDMPHLPWLEEAQLHISEDTMNLSPQESEVYWAKKRAEWQKTPLGRDIGYLNGKVVENGLV